MATDGMEQIKGESGCRLLNTGVEAPKANRNMKEVENQSDTLLIISLQEV